MISGDTGLMVSGDTGLMVSGDTGLMVSGDTGLMVSGDTGLMDRVTATSQLTSHFHVSPQTTVNINIFKKLQSHFHRNPNTQQIKPATQCATVYPSNPICSQRFVLNRKHESFTM